MRTQAATSFDTFTGALPAAAFTREMSLLGLQVVMRASRRRISPKARSMTPSISASGRWPSE